MNKSKGGAKPCLQSNKSNCHGIVTGIESLANNRQDNGKDKTKQEPNHVPKQYLYIIRKLKRNPIFMIQR